LTATVKLFLKKGTGAQELVQRLLKTATSECDNPDIRDRAYVYWRLLSASGQVAKSVVLSEKPPINPNQQILSPRLLDELVAELGSLASVYHKPADSFVGKGKFGADAVQRRAIEYQTPPRTFILLCLIVVVGLLCLTGQGANSECEGESDSDEIECGESS